jgi:hypothetical protein
VLCSSNTAGLWQGMSLPWNTSERKRDKLIFCCCVK